MVQPTGADQGLDFLERLSLAEISPPRSPKPKAATKVASPKLQQTHTRPKSKPAAGARRRVTFSRSPVTRIEEAVSGLDRRVGTCACRTDLSITSPCGLVLEPRVGKHTSVELGVSPERFNRHALAPSPGHPLVLPWHPCPGSRLALSSRISQSAPLVPPQPSHPAVASCTPSRKIDSLAPE